MHPGIMPQPGTMTPSFPRPYSQHPSHGMNPMAQQMQSTIPGQQMTAPAPAPKVNPALIPSVVAVLEADVARFRESGQPYLTSTSVIDQSPPLPTTRSAKIIDDGNSSPSLIRSTLNHVPITEEICENSKIPLALLVQPFADVARLEGGRFFVCNLCGMANDVPDDYYANLDMSGRRIDLDYRPELKYGTIDFVASKVC
jgi:protein transport protein SEC24